VSDLTEEGKENAI